MLIFGFSLNSFLTACLSKLGSWVGFRGYRRKEQGDLGWPHREVPKESEDCQRDCAIARMWATLFWGSQAAIAGGFFYVFASDREVRSGEGAAWWLAAKIAGICWLRFFSRERVSSDPAQKLSQLFEPWSCRRGWAWWRGM